MATETLPIDRIHKAFEDLETQKSLISNCALQWQKLSDHFSSIEKTLADRSQTIDSKFESLDSQTKQALESLDHRQASLPRRESSAVALIEERRASIVADIVNLESRPPRSLSGILRWHSRRMDAPGLRRFMVSRRKELDILRRELSEAISDSVDPPRLVLDAFEDYLSNPAATATAAGEKCWAVGAMVKVLLDLLGKEAVAVSDSIRDRAAVVTECWRAKFLGKEAEEERAAEDNKVEGDKEALESAEARIFLRMVIAFGLRSKFEDDFLLKLVLENSMRKETAKHAARLGFGEKVEEIIELVKNGKEIDAIYIARESGLLDKFSPVPLLNSHLQNSKRSSNAMMKRNQSGAYVDGYSNMELRCLKSIIKCVETLNMEQKFALETLKKRVGELEASTAERKRKQESRPPQSKRSKQRSGRGNSGFRSSRPSRRSRAHTQSYPQNPPVAPRVPPARQPYNFAPQVRFDIHPSTSYGAAAHRSTPMPQYYTPGSNAVARNTMPYGAPAVSYGSYDYNGAPAPPQYQQ
ncbi:hypothetical protein KSP39_PZI010893 [Platanthera zijinensis]|uniref:FRIGIDA-like protein n=1 Tax=Platanthera zijinensis TaxID=2320716 RepID=A0AAP0BH99_9ASPA